MVNMLLILGFPSCPGSLNSRAHMRRESRDLRCFHGQEDSELGSFSFFTGEIDAPFIGFDHRFDEAQPEAGAMLTAALVPRDRGAPRWAADRRREFPPGCRGRRYRYREDAVARRSRPRVLGVYLIELSSRLANTCRIRAGSTAAESELARPLVILTPFSCAMRSTRAAIDYTLVTRVTWSCKRATAACVMNAHSLRRTIAILLVAMAAPVISSCSRTDTPTVTTTPSPTATSTPVATLPVAPATVATPPIAGTTAPPLPPAETPMASPTP